MTEGMDLRDPQYLHECLKSIAGLEHGEVLNMHVSMCRESGWLSWDYSAHDRSYRYVLTAAGRAALAEFESK